MRCAATAWIESASECLKPVARRFSHHAINSDFCVENGLDEDRHTRSNANIDYARLVVLDGDGGADKETGEVTPGAPDPRFAHDVLRGTSS